MIRINTISNYKAWYRYIKNPSNYIENKVNKINCNLKEYKKKTIFCTLLLSGSNEIKRLNKKFRKKDKITDVLSFPNYKNLNLKKIKKKDIYLGDLILNFYKIDKKNFKKEFDKLWIHGFLHLLGHKHYKNNDYYKMHKLEKKILTKIENN